jgi:excisionase family DNA binding protein
MTFFSLTAAAKQVNKSKPTISKAIKTGRLSAKKVGQGYEIDAAELFRVYPPDPPSEPPKQTTSTNAVNLLELEAKMLRDQLARERETVDDLRKRLDRAERLIEDHRPAPAAKAKRGWWPF